MKTLSLTLPAIALILAGCGPKTLALPTDPVEQAAMCGVVAGAAARAGQTPAEIAKPLPLDAQGRILHYALLAGAAEEPFSQDRVAAVVALMPKIGNRVIEGKWQALAPACAAAYPQSQVTVPIELPADGLNTQLSCYTLSAFVDKALAAQRSTYAADMKLQDDLRRKLDGKIGSRLAAQGKDSAETQAQGRSERLAAAAKLGPPMQVLAACAARYG